MDHRKSVTLTPEPTDRSDAWTERAREAVGRFHPRPTLDRRLLAPGVVALCKGLMQVLNTVEFHHAERLTEARALGRPLLTFSNHVSLFDDPWLMATMSGSRWRELRWIATDALNFFDTPVKAWFFSLGKGVPIVRGAGLDQPGFHFLEERLDDGDWVHVFPEGTRSRTPQELHRPFKPGLAFLIRATRPLLLPFHHRGMEDILPIGTRFPRFGNTVSVRFGEITDAAAGLADASIEEITTWAEEQLLGLQAQAG